MEPSAKMLDCGCVRGRIGCEEALDVLRRMGAAYADGIRTGHWKPFNDLRCALERHYTSHQASSD